MSQTFHLELLIIKMESKGLAETYRHSLILKMLKFFNAENNSFGFYGCFLMLP